MCCVLRCQSCLTLCDPMDCIARQVPLAMEFSRQECWSALPCPPPGDLPNPGIELRSPTLQANSLPAERAIRNPHENQFAKNTLVVFAPLKGYFYSGYVWLLSTKNEKKQSYQNNMGNKISSKIHFKHPQHHDWVQLAICPFDGLKAQGA